MVVVTGVPSTRRARYGPFPSRVDIASSMPAIAHGSMPAIAHGLIGAQSVAPLAISVLAEMAEPEEALPVLDRTLHESGVSSAFFLMSATRLTRV
jgi:hypothetical protein